MKKLVIPLSLLLVDLFSMSVVAVCSNDMKAYWKFEGTTDVVEDSKNGFHGSVPEAIVEYTKAVSLVSSSALTDQQIMVKFDSASIISQGKMQSDCDDVRFKDNDGNSLNFWLEGGCNTANTIYWVKVPNVPTGSSDIHMTYGNPSLSSASNGANTFFAFKSSGSSGQVYSEGALYLDLGFNAINDYTIDIKFDKEYAHSRVYIQGSDVISISMDLGTQGINTYETGYHVIAEPSPRPVVLSVTPKTHGKDIYALDTNRVQKGYEYVQHHKYGEPETLFDQVLAGSYTGYDIRPRFYWTIVRSYTPNPPSVSVGTESKLIRDATGLIDKSLYLDGDDNYVIISDDSELDLTSAHSIATWIYPSDLSSAQQIISKMSGNSADGGWGLG
ncbi:DUF2341 domain-containing protein, partial [Candidatus Woesearchaeota archaeon]|nr:DUF2341 domain-containing protein [Candidatus Woesearchaeota archaeon]